jgi:ATP-dependent DNA helicase RecQ
MRPTDRRRRIAHIVTKVFGLSGLRPGQQAVIDAVLAGTHTLAIMPTGAGKSLCYQVPAMLMPGTTVVVSPLIALMQDQFEKTSDTDKQRQLVELGRGLDGAAIIYAATVKHVEQIHALLGTFSV